MSQQYQPTQTWFLFGGLIDLRYLEMVHQQFTVQTLYPVLLIMFFKLITKVFSSEQNSVGMIISMLKM